VAAGLADLVVAPGATPAAIDTAGTFAVSGVTPQGTVVRIAMQAGDAGTVRHLFVELFDREVRTPAGALARSAAPLSTANFLSYVDRGRYESTFFHRATDFAGDSGPARFLQGGGFSIGPNGVASVPTDAPIALEWGADRPNAAGTIAFARTTDPNSATSGFFFNTVANPSFDTAGNRYAVFGRVVGDGAAILAEAAALPRVDARGGNPASPFGTLPVSDLVNLTWDNLPERLLMLLDADVVPGAATAFGVTATSSAPGVVAVRVDEAGRLRLAAGPGTGSALVTVTGTDLSGARVDDTFTVWVGVPGIAVSAAGAALTSGQATPLSLGRVPRGAAPRTTSFTVTNTGDAPLDLGPPQLPEGVTCTGDLPARVPAGGTARFTLALDTRAARSVAATAIIPSSAPGGAFVIPLAGAVYGPPAAPSAPGAAWQGGRRIVVSWSQEGDGPVAGSSVFARRGGEGAWVRVAEVRGPATTAALDGLAPDAAWSFRIVARNAAGLSDPSSPSPVIVAPLPPAALLVAADGPGAVRLRWAHAAQPLDGLTGLPRPLQGYVLFYRRAGDGDWTRFGALSVTTTARVAGLVPGSLYQFALRARSASGGSPLSRVSAAVRVT